MIMRMGDRPVLPIVVLACSGLLIAACGSSSSSGGAASSQPPQASSSSPPASAAPSVTPSLAAVTASPSPTATALSTAALKAALLPKTAAPAGYTLQHVGAAPPNGELGCGRNGVTPQHEVGADFEGSRTRIGAQIEEFIRGYPSVAVAHKAMLQIVAFAKTCHQASLYKIKPIGYPPVGGLTVAMAISESSPVGGVAASGQLVFALTGTTIVELVAIGSPSVKAAKTLPLLKAAVSRVS
jgi:hypothetical protein